MNHNGAADALKPLDFIRKPKQPFRLDLTSWVLRRHPQNIIDRFENGEYGRVVVINNQVAELSVTQPGASSCMLQVLLLTEGSSSSDLIPSANLLLDRLLGPKIDLTGFYNVVKKDPTTGDLVKKFVGVKPPRFPSVFESLVNAIACQQVSLSVGLLLLKRLASSFGPSIYIHGKNRHGFPLPEKLARLDYQALRNLGFSGRKSEYIVEVAKMAVRHDFDLEELASMTNEEAVEVLTQIRGVGGWSAEYVLLRGLGRLNVFPADDAGAQNSLRAWFHLHKKPDYEKAMRIISKWQPYAGMLYFHFLLHRLSSDEQNPF
ncbi:MAG: DNA-3-methyladenine glycosylase 2 family protein [Thaumarchaeota archaeon]|nr:DNA-3-methyladenine glycosylase 2 family protein [Nitrososphaerota archaeon]